MISTVKSFGIRGIRGFLTEVETYVVRGIPEFEVIGLGDASVKEAKRRVTAALRNQGYEVPSGRITVNLAPSCVKKEGTSFDLAIAVGLLCASGILKEEKLQQYAFLGELSLDGSIRPINGVMAMILEGRRQGIEHFIVPEENSTEGALVQGAHVYGIGSLRNIHEVLAGTCLPCPYHSIEEGIGDDASTLCFSQVLGQQSVKRALEIAAAGGHHILMLGTAGSGKSMLARRLVTILPHMTQEEMYEVTAIHSVCGIKPSHSLLRGQRPFREIHTGITKAGLIGGQLPILPGEVSLAHRGVLFWDEMTEGERTALDALRQPLEAGEVRISRAGQGEIYPADFLFVGAANPCRCGRLLEGDGSCRCTPIQIQRYLAKISKPLLDRLDLHVPVRSLSPEEMENDSLKAPLETSVEIQKRVLQARALQTERYRNESVSLNACITRNMIEKYCFLSTSGKKLLSSAIRRLGLSMRAYEKILQVSRTVADINGHTAIEPIDIAEAIQYRQYDGIFASGIGREVCI